MNVKQSKYLIYIFSIIFFNTVNAQQTSGLVSNIILNQAENDSDFPIVFIDKLAASIRYDVSDFKGVIRAIGDLQNDITV